MMDKFSQQDIENVTLLLAYITSWDDNPSKKFGDKPAVRTFKNFGTEVLVSLQEKGLISETSRARSIFLTEDGVKKAKELVEQMLSR